MDGRLDADRVADVRVCFVGDSYIAGAGDGSGLGWVGRLTSHAHAAGRPITAYNLGVRGDTSRDVAIRLPDEVSRRVTPGAQTRVVLGYGLNDVVLDNGQPRLTAADSSLATSRNLAWLATARIPAIFVGPPPIGDVDQDSRTEDLDQLLAELVGSRGVTYISPFRRLSEDFVWLAGVREGDGAHPGSAGYQRYFEAVREPLMSFLLLPPIDLRAHARQAATLFAGRLER